MSYATTATAPVIQVFAAAPRHAVTLELTATMIVFTGYER